MSKAKDKITLSASEQIALIESVVKEHNQKALPGLRFDIVRLGEESRLHICMHSAPVRVPGQAYAPPTPVEQIKRVSSALGSFDTSKPIQVSSEKGFKRDIEKKLDACVKKIPAAHINVELVKAHNAENAGTPVRKLELVRKEDGTGAYLCSSDFYPGMVASFNWPDADTKGRETFAKETQKEIDALTDAVVATHLICHEKLAHILLTYGFTGNAYINPNEKTIELFLKDKEDRVVETVTFSYDFSMEKPFDEKLLWEETIPSTLLHNYLERILTLRQYVPEEQQAWFANVDTLLADISSEMLKKFEHLHARKGQFGIVVQPLADGNFSVTAKHPAIPATNLDAAVFKPTGNLRYLSERDFLCLQAMEHSIEKAAVEQGGMDPRLLKRPQLIPPVTIMVDAVTFSLLARSRITGGDGDDPAQLRCRARDDKGPSYLTLLEKLAALGVDIVIPKVVAIEMLRNEKIKGSAAAPSTIESNFLKHAVPNNLIPGIRIVPLEAPDTPSYREILAAKTPLTPTEYMILSKALAEDRYLSSQAGQAERGAIHRKLDDNKATADLGEKHAAELMEGIARSGPAIFITEDKKARQEAKHDCANLRWLLQFLEERGILGKISAKSAKEIAEDIQSQHPGAWMEAAINHPQAFDGVLKRMIFHNIHYATFSACAS